MGDNLIRAARSTTRNIAEASGRYHYMDKVKFCGYSRGSTLEVLDDLITCHDDGLISDELLKEGRQHVSTEVKITNGYIRDLRKVVKSAQNNKVKEPRLTVESPWGNKDSPSEFDDEDPEQDYPSSSTE
jgi:four helix bundle protein